MSCADVQTIQSGNGTTKTQFSFDFPYIFKSEIHVYFWNATTKEWDEKLTTDATYPWQIDDANPTIVEFTGTAPPAPAVPVDPGETAVDNVQIRRITKIDDIRALFNPGSAIRSDDLNRNFEQVRYAIQEANCPGVPEDVDQYLRDYYWDRFDNTIYDGNTWVSDDTKIATTAAIDDRVDAKIDTAITTDITGSDGIVVSENGTGRINITIQDGGIDLVELHEDSIVIRNESKQDVYVSPNNNLTTLSDDNVLTSAASEHRYRNYYQQETPSTGNATNPVPGQFWLRPGADPNDPESTTNTLSMWDGSNWIGVASGGTFTNQPTTIYVDRYSGDDVNNDGRRIIHQVRTIERALELANDGDMISVAPGVYQENFPLNIRQKNLSIVGDSIRSVFIQPKQANEYEMVDNVEYTDEVKNPNFNSAQPESPTNLRWISATLLADPNGTPPSNPNYNQTVESNMFRLNSGTYISNMTFVGMKANGTRGDHPIDNHNDYGLPEKQGWIFGLMPGCYIAKSPYIQNCTNFSDSAIDNSQEFDPSNSGFDPDTNQARPGYAGDNTSSPTGGAIIVDGNVPNINSPLRSIVADSFTQVGLNGPGILVCNNGYTQLTSSYSFFTHYHLKALNGGQANLAASTTDFGRYALIADGKSTNAIFTANVVGNYNTGDTSIQVSNGTAGSSWFGTATRPSPNMLLAVNNGADIYAITGTVPTDQATYDSNPSGYTGNWTVSISNPDPTNKANNLGLASPVSAGNDAAEFYIRSMIASSGHTMEYVGSGTDYNALPENGGVPIEAQQINELNDGKIWAVTVDHKGKLKAGEDFAVDQESGAVLLGTGALAIPTLITGLDTNGQTITDSQGDIQIGKNVDMNSKKIVGLGSPTTNTDAVNRAYVDNNTVSSAGDTMTGDLAMGTNKVTGLGTPTNDTDAATKLYADRKVETVAVTAPITQSNATTNGVKTVTLDINDATTSAAGVVQLNDSINDTSTTTAATANAVKTAFDSALTANTTANAALPKTGGTMLADLNLDSGVNLTFDGGGANGEISGITNSTSTISSTVVASATAVKAAYDHVSDALFLDGSNQMSGNIDLNSNDIINGGDISAVSVTTTGNIVIGGNLQVEGTTTTVNSTEITLDDKNLTLGAIVGEDFVGNTTNNSPTITGVSNADFAKVIINMLVTGNGVPANTYIVSKQTVNNINQVTLSNSISGNQQSVTFSQPGPSDSYADGGGITVKATTDKTFNYLNTNWTSSEHINLASGKEFKIAGTSVLNGSTLGSNVTASSLTSVGTIGTGIWNGTAIGVDYGGTGLTTTPTNGQLAIGNGTGYTLATLTAGNNVSITEGSGSITIASTDTNTTYTAGDGLDLTGTEFSPDLKANGGLVIEGNDKEIAVDLGASAITGTLAVGDGGTGQTSYTDGELLIGNSTGNTLNKATLTAGTNVTITNGSGAITIDSTDTNTTYTAGDGLDLTNTEFSVDLAANGGLEISNTELQVDSTVVRTTGGTFTGDLFLSETSGNVLNTLAFKELASNGSNYVGFKAPNAITADVTWTLPAADGTTTQTLSTDGNGILYWQTPTAVALKGGGGDQVFVENDQVVTTNYTITTNKNAMSAGPITVNQGVTVTIPTGSTWTVV